MLSKRVFWLTCAAIVSWLIWMRLRQRQDEFASSTPQFAPPRTFAPATPAAAPAYSAVTPATVPSAATKPAASTSNAADLAKATEPSAAVEPIASASKAAGEADDPAEAEISGYCMRCKTKRTIQNAHRETTESGRPAARGTCPICGANMFTFLASNDET